MADWLHCNTCYRQPGDGCIFYLTGCGHIFCVKCENKGWKEKCLLCGVGHPSIHQLTAKLPLHVQPFFSNLQAKLQQINCSSCNVRQIVQALVWQTCHQKRYFRYMKNMIEQQKCYITKQEQKERDFQQKERDFKNYVDKLKRDVRELFEQKSNQFQSHIEMMEKEHSKVKAENNYLKRLLSEKNQAALLRCSPSGDRNRCNSSPTMKGNSGDRNRCNISPTMKGIAGSSPSSLIQQRASQDRLHGQQSSHNYGYDISPSSGQYIISGKSAIRTPPSSGFHQLSPQQPVYSSQKTSQTVPSIEERLLNQQRSQDAVPRIYSTTTVIAPGRISVRTPPSGGRLGVIPSTPSSQFYRPNTPKLVDCLATAEFGYESYQEALDRMALRPLMMCQSATPHK